MNKKLKFMMTTYAPSGQVYQKDKTYKTKAGMRRAKEKQNLAYGSHLRAVAVEIFEDGTTIPTLCLA
jgi:hypothetical protein